LYKAPLTIHFITLTIEKSEGFKAQEEEQQDNIQYQVSLWVREYHPYNSQSKQWLHHKYINVNR